MLFTFFQRNPCGGKGLEEQLQSLEPVLVSCCCSYGYAGKDQQAWLCAPAKQAPTAVGASAKVCSETTSATAATSAGTYSIASSSTSRALSYRSGVGAGLLRGAVVDPVLSWPGLKGKGRAGDATLKAVGQGAQTAVNGPAVAACLC